MGQCCRKTELILNLKKGYTEFMLFVTLKRLHLHGRDLNMQYKIATMSFVRDNEYLGNIHSLMLNSNFNRTCKRSCGRLTLLEYLTTEAYSKISKAVILLLLT